MGQTMLYYFLVQYANPAIVPSTTGESTEW